jgi:hypothetical protein
MWAPALITTQVNNKEFCYGRQRRERFEIKNRVYFLIASSFPGKIQGIQTMVNMILQCKAEME